MAKKNKQEAGTYILTADAHEVYELSDDKKTIIGTERYEKGEEIELDEKEATRLVEADAVAKPDSLKAKVALGELPEETARLAEKSEVELQHHLDAVKRAIAAKREHAGPVDAKDPADVSEEAVKRDRSELDGVGDVSGEKDSSSPKQRSSKQGKSSNQDKE